MVKLTVLLLGFLTAVACPGICLAQDVTPPRLTAFSFTPTSVDTTNGSATVTVSFTVTDDSSGAAYFEMSFFDSNQIVVGRASKTLSGALSVSGSVNVTFPQFSNTGTYSVGGVYVSDASGNGVFLNTTALNSAGFSTALAVTSAVDSTSPRLIALSFPGAIDTTSAAANLTVNFSATDDLSGVKTFQIGFVSPSGANQLPGTATVTPALSASGSATVAFPQFLEAGTWTVGGVTVIDAAGNSLSLDTAGAAALGFPTTLTVTSSADSTPPNLTAFNFTPSTVDTTSGPGVVTVNFSATDNLSGVKSVQLGFSSPSGATVQQGNATVTPSTSVNGSATVTFPSFGEAGTWTVTSVVVTDAAGNQTTYNTGALATAGFPTTLTVTSSSDSTPPTLSALSFAPTSIDVANSSAGVAVSFQVADDLSGVTAFQAAFMSPSGEAIQAASSNFPANPSVSSTATATFPRGSEDGVWTLASVYLSDAAHNVRVYSTSDLIGRGFQTQLTVHSGTQPPMAASQSQTVSYPGPASFILNTNDPAGAALTYHQTASPNKGGVVVNCTTSCTATYTPNSGVGGTDSFSYFVTNPSNLSSATVTVTITIQAVDVTGQTSITPTTTTFNRATSTYTTVFVVKNTSATSIAAPLQFVLTSVPSGASITNATGTVPSGPYSGSPYITVPGNSSLAAGASVNVTVQFKNPGGATLGAVPKVLSGGF